uniref:THAP4-like heme-binding domain-containing protein n=1 Tax=Bombyx mori TaxID=7091 RepID=A0A8R2R9Z9_BOMMO|nr:uncharacterized protein LOC119630424 isoform X3 [Bombyx mori]
MWKNETHPLDVFVTKSKSVEDSRSFGVWRPSPISCLEGRWCTTETRGYYPNIPDFSYHEDLEFICVGHPMHNFLSMSRHP